MLVLIDHLRITDLKKQVSAQSRKITWRWSVSEKFMRSHRLRAGLRFRERVHEGHQIFSVGSGEIGLEGVREAAFQAGLPAGTAVMQIRAASSQFARRIHQHSVRAPNDAHQLAFRQHGAASNAGPLGDVLHPLKRFLGHLRDKALLFGHPRRVAKSEG